VYWSDGWIQPVAVSGVITTAQLSEGRIAICDLPDRPLSQAEGHEQMAGLQRRQRPVRRGTRASPGTACGCREAHARWCGGSVEGPFSSYIPVYRLPRLYTPIEPNASAHGWPVTRAGPPVGRPSTTGTTSWLSLTSGSQPRTPSQAPARVPRQEIRGYGVGLTGRSDAPRSPGRTEREARRGARPLLPRCRGGPGPDPCAHGIVGGRAREGRRGDRRGRPIR
jgi:hypothetical protein